MQDAVSELSNATTLESLSNPDIKDAIAMVWPSAITTPAQITALASQLQTAATEISNGTSHDAVTDLTLREVVKEAFPILTTADSTATYSLKSAVIKDSTGNTINDDDGNPITVQGLEIKADGSWSFNPANAAYNALAQGETQTINVSYQVADAAGLTGENSFSITLTGTNDDPTATFSATQTTTEDNAVLSGRLPVTDANANGLAYALTAGTAVSYTHLTLPTILLV